MVQSFFYHFQQKLLMGMGRDKNASLKVCSCSDDELQIVTWLMIYRCTDHACTSNCHLVDGLSRLHCSDVNSKLSLSWWFIEAALQWRWTPNDELWLHWRWSPNWDFVDGLWIHWRWSPNWDFVDGLWIHWRWSPNWDFVDGLWIHWWWSPNCHFVDGLWIHWRWTPNCHLVN